MADMNLELRDELAAHVAAGLATSSMSPRDIAIRAYAIADAMLRERGYDTAGDAELYEPLPEAVDPRIADVPYEPSWELEPRWSPDDAARRDARIAAGPGLAHTRSSSSSGKRTG